MTKPASLPIVRLHGLDRNTFALLRDPSRFLLRICREYGDIVQVRLGPLKIHLVNSAEYVHQVLVAQHTNMRKGPAFHLAKSVLGNGLLTSDGEFHLRQRRLAQPPFHRHRIESYVPLMVDCMERVHTQWRPGSTLEMFSEMSKMTLTIAAETLFGTDIESKASDVREALTDALSGWTWSSLPLAYLTHRLHVPLPGSRGVRKARVRLDEIVYQIIQERRESEEVYDDLLSRLMRAVDDEGDGTGMTDLQLRDEATTLILAGHETIATTLMWAWYLLSKHPDVEAKLHAEVDRVLGDRAPTAEDLPNLEYTRRVLAETLRLYPALWIFSRKVMKDTWVGPYQLKAGTQVAPSPFVTHRNPKYFPDPEKFDPDRWIPQSADALPDGAYFPFGLGVRRCLGEAFAWVEGTLAIAAVTRRWRMRLVPGTEIKIKPAFILRSHNGMPMRLERRGEVASAADGRQASNHAGDGGINFAVSSLTRPSPEEVGSGRERGD